MIKSKEQVNRYASQDRHHSRTGVRPFRRGRVGRDRLCAGGVRIRWRESSGFLQLVGSAEAAPQDRTNICNALGEEDHPGGNSEVGFLSAGNYDALKFTFGGPFTGPIDFFEITFGNANGPNSNWQESLGLVF